MAEAESGSPLRRERAEEALGAQRATWVGWRWFIRTGIAYAVVFAVLRLLNGRPGDAVASVLGIAVGTMLIIGVGYLLTRRRVASLRSAPELTSATVKEAFAVAGRGQVRVELSDGTQATWATGPSVEWLSPGQQVWCTPIANGSLVRLVGLDAGGTVRVLEPGAAAILQWDPNWRDHLPPGARARRDPPPGRC